jgi:hypothetical protein
VPITKSTEIRCEGSVDRQDLREMYPDPGCWPDTEVRTNDAESSASGYLTQGYRTFASGVRLYSVPNCRTTSGHASIRIEVGAYVAGFRHCGFAGCTHRRSSVEFAGGVVGHVRFDRASQSPMPYQNRQSGGSRASGIPEDTLVRWFIDHRALLIHLPPYSPELNLIEIIWKKLKYHWRRFVTWSKESFHHELTALLGGYGSNIQICLS